MKLFTRTLGFVLAAALSACAGGSRGTSVPSSSDAGVSQGTSTGLDIGKTLRRTELPNGLRIVVREDPSVPLVSTMVAYRIGAVYEVEGITGATHFLEHMLFKEFGDHDENYLDLWTATAGGINNAFTTEDMTGYWFTVPKDKWQEVLAIEADRMRSSRINVEPFEREKGAVMQERDGRMDSPYGELYQELNKTAFEKIGYHHPVLGWESDLAAMKAEDLRRFYNDYYWPNNASLIVVGDVKAEEVFRVASETIGKIPGQGKTPTLRELEPPQTAPKSFEIKTAKEQNRAVVGFRTDKIATKADYVLDLVSAILTHGKDSRLHRRLVEQEKLVMEGGVDAWNETRTHDGLFTVLAELRGGADARRVVAAVNEELEKLKTEDVTPRELEKSKNIRIAGFVFGKEDQNDFASDLGRFDAMGAPNYIDTYVAEIEKITAADVREIAVKHFVENARTTGYAWAAGRSADGRWTKWGWRHDRAGEIGAMQDDLHLPSFGEMTQAVLRNGLTILVKPRRETGLPIVYAKLFVNASPYYDPKGKEGLANLVGNMLDQGTPTRTHADIAAEVDFRGAELSTDSSGVEIKCLKKDEKWAYELLADLALNAAFDASRLAVQKQNVIDGIKALEDDPAALSRTLLRERVYENHPLGHPADGWENSVAGLTRQDVVAHHRRYFRPDNAIITVVGDVTAHEAVTELRHRFAVDWRAEGALDLPQIPAVPRQTGRAAHYRFKETKQVNVSIGFAGLTRENPDYEALLVAEFCLFKGPGFSDRLSQEVRVKNGLAYEVWGDVTRSSDWWQSLGIVYYGARADRKDEAWDVAHGCIDGFIKSGPTPEELEMARSFVLRNFAFRWSTFSRIADYMIAVQRWRLGADYPRRFERAVRAVTADDVKRVAQKYLSADDVTMVVVGPVDDKGNLIEVKGPKNP